MENKIVKEFLEQDEFKGNKSHAKEAIFFFFSYLRACFKNPDMPPIYIKYFGKFMTGLKKLKVQHKRLLEVKNKTKYTYENIKHIERKIAIHDGRMFENAKKRN